MLADQTGMKSSIMCEGKKIDNYAPIIGQAYFPLTK